MDAYVFSEMIGLSRTGDNHYLYCFAHGTGDQQTANRELAKTLIKDDHFKQACLNIAGEWDHLGQEELDAGILQKDPVNLYHQHMDNMLQHLIETWFAEVKP